MRWRIPFIDRIVGRLSLRIQQLDVKVETKTKDNVFVFVIVSVQYYVIDSKVVDAFYRLQQPELQIRSYVYDVVRARVPGIKLDSVFETKDDIAQAVRQELAQIMDDFGYGIVKALVTDIDPDPNVKASMNQINAAQRLRVAAVEEAEAEKNPRRQSGRSRSRIESPPRQGYRRSTVGDCQRLAGERYGF